MTNEEEVFSKLMTELFSTENFFNDLSNLIPSIILYMDSCSKCPLYEMPENSYTDLSHFAVLCLESINYLINVNNSIKINFIDLALCCAEKCLKEPLFLQVFSSVDNISWLCSCVNSIYIFVKYFLLDGKSLPLDDVDCFKSNLFNVEALSSGHACYQLSNLITWLEKSKNTHCSIVTNSFIENVKSITISLSRMSLLNSFALTPPSYLKVTDGIQLSGIFLTHVPPLPIKYLQEVDILEEFIFR